MENFQAVGLDHVVVTQAFGFYLLNIDNVYINRSTFTTSPVTHYAALGLHYNKLTSQITVAIENAQFMDNSEVNDYLPAAGISGLIVFDFFDLINAYANNCNVTLLVHNCQFRRNRLPSYGSSTPLLYVNGAVKYTISMVMDGCLFESNIFSFFHIGFYESVKLLHSHQK